MTITNIITLSPRAVTPGVQNRFPNSGGQTAPGGFLGIQIMINLSTADKEAVGKQLGLGFYRLDGSFIAGFPMEGFPGIPAGTASPWVSYGGPITVDIPNYATGHGTILVTDPDPTVNIPITTLGGQQIFVIYQTLGITLAGVTINGLS